MRATLLPASIALFLGCLLFSPWCTPLQADGKKPNEGEELSLRTAYLTDAIAGAHRIAVRGPLDGAGVLTLDPNACALNEFGDPSHCTRMAVRTIPVRFLQAKLADPSGAKRRLFELSGKLPEGYRFALVLGSPSRGEEGARDASRLLVDKGGSRRHVLPLESPPGKPAPAEPKPELCRSVSYTAQQVGAWILIVAAGMAPTPGWKATFIQLPVPTYPPQYKLVCKRPRGMWPQVMTPYTSQVSFLAKGEVGEVIVHDAGGEHKVPVRKAKRR